MVADTLHRKDEVSFPPIIPSATLDEYRVGRRQYHYCFRNRDDRPPAYTEEESSGLYSTPQTGNDGVPSISFPTPLHYGLTTEDGSPFPIQSPAPGWEPSSTSLGVNSLPGFWCPQLSQPDFSTSLSGELYRPSFPSQGLLSPGSSDHGLGEPPGSYPEQFGPKQMSPEQDQSNPRVSTPSGIFPPAQSPSSGAGRRRRSIRRGLSDVRSRLVRPDGVCFFLSVYLVFWKRV